MRQRGGPKEVLLRGCPNRRSGLRPGGACNPLEENKFFLRRFMAGPLPALPFFRFYLSGKPLNAMVLRKTGTPNPSSRLAMAFPLAAASDTSLPHRWAFLTRNGKVLEGGTKA